MRLIDADAIPYEEYYVPDPDSNAQWDYKKELSVIKPVVDQMPTVDAVEVVHGRWKEICLAGGFSEEWGYVCSACGCVVSERSGLGIWHYKQNQKLNYCPNCGADMRGDWND